MKLIADWGVASERLDRLLERGCLACAGERGRLVRHEVPIGMQVWLSCCSCGSRIEGPLPHSQHPQFPLYPIWREGGCDYLLPEEPRPLRLHEIVRAVYAGGDPRLAHAHADAEQLIVATGLLDPLNLTPAISAILAACGPKAYVAAEFGDEGSLLSIEPERIQMLTPRLVGQKVQWGRARVVG